MSRSTRADSSPVAALRVCMSEYRWRLLQEMIERLERIRQAHRARMRRLRRAGQEDD